MSSPSRGWSWRARIAHALDGRSLILVLAILLLIVSVAVGASRSAMLALACAAGYVAWPRRGGMGSGDRRCGPARSRWPRHFAVIAYADLDRLLSRVDETRQLGLAQRVAIWRDTLGIIRDFPLTGDGARNFFHRDAAVSDERSHLFLERGPQPYLQVAAEGRLLFVIPARVALAA